MAVNTPQAPLTFRIAITLQQWHSKEETLWIARTLSEPVVTERAARRADATRALRRRVTEALTITLKQGGLQQLLLQLPRSPSRVRRFELPVRGGEQDRHHDLLLLEEALGTLRIATCPTFFRQRTEVHDGDRAEDVGQLLMEREEKAERRGFSSQESESQAGYTVRATIEEEIDVVIRTDASKSTLREHLDALGPALPTRTMPIYDRVVERDAEISSLAEWVADPLGGSLALVGRRGVGKRSIVQAALAHCAERVRAKDGLRVLPYVRVLEAERLLVPEEDERRTWLERLHAAIEAALISNALLVLPDPLMWFAPRLGSDRGIAFATPLLPLILARRLRAIFLVTPEEHGRLIACEPRLNGRISVFVIHPKGPPASLRMTVAAMQRAEQETSTRFSPIMLKECVDLAERFDRGTELPGRVSRHLEALATGSANASEDGLVRAHFRAHYSIEGSALRWTASLSRDEVVHRLSQAIFGQPEAVLAMADLVLRYQANVSDPRRPVAVLLFTGPTGTGKTECAKVLAEELFGTASRLQRLDLNEYTDADAARRLVGDFLEPEGRLIALARQQPYGVLLFDEIEKAHPDVFDVLLQVFGDARLADGRGDAVSFAQTIIIMTSNLGAGTEQLLGFHRDAKSQAESWIQAAEQYFRIEFLNRIDRVVPFQPLDTSALRSIARRMLHSITAREGFRGRQIILHVEPDALDPVVLAATRGAAGARNLRQELERQLILPVARSTMAKDPASGTLCWARSAPSGIEVQLYPLQAANLATEQRVAELSLSAEEVVRLAAELQSKAREWLQAPNRGEEIFVAGSQSIAPSDLKRLWWRSAFRALAEVESEARAMRFAEDAMREDDAGLHHRLGGNLLRQGGQDPTEWLLRASRTLALLLEERSDDEVELEIHGFGYQAQAAIQCYALAYQEALAEFYASWSGEEYPTTAPAFDPRSQSSLEMPNKVRLSLEGPAISTLVAGEIGAHALRHSRHGDGVLVVAPAGVALWDDRKQPMRAVRTLGLEPSEQGPIERGQRDRGMNSYFDYPRALARIRSELDSGTIAQLGKARKGSMEALVMRITMISLRPYLEMKQAIVSSLQAAALSWSPLGRSDEP